MTDIKKAPLEPPPFERLPDEIIEQILSAADPNGFASLVLLNRKWRTVSQRAYLYLRQLAQCPSRAASSHPPLPPADDDQLPALRRLFAREVKRSLFDAYLRPHETVIKLVSNSISSSSCPGGEGMQFSASPKCQLFLAYNSSRIYIIDVRGETAEVKREFKILRRPVAACVKDDATLLAVLSTEMQVDIYDLGSSPPRRKQAIILDNTPRTIALSPCGSVLAAAYEGGIEVSSLNPGASPAEKRSVKCDAVDSLAFSFDGTQILGTTTHSPTPSTVVLTAPYYDPGNLLTDDNISGMWTTSILFPNSSRDCSHAVLLQDGNEEEASWSFAYDRSFETFRAVRIDDLRNGTTYFTGPVPKAASQAKMLPSTLPGATFNGEVVAAGFHSKEVWVYGIPENLDAVPETASSNADRSSLANALGRRNSEHSNASKHPSSRGGDTDEARVPQWQLLCDKLRNTLVPGHKITDVPGLSSAKWVANFSDNSLKERLVVTARGVSGPRLVTEEEDIDFIDGGRMTLLDFDYRLDDGSTTEITIEVGTDNAEVLEEERRDIEAEVAIVRRRTVAQRRGGRRSALLRAATSARDIEVPVSPILPTEDDDDDPLVPRRIGVNPVRGVPADDAAEDPDVATIEEQEAMESPYAHASPRSAPTLRRAATAAAVNQRLHPRTADGRPIEYRRADGRREHPHESDADNWVPPPPPYQKEDPGDLPAFLRGPAVSPANLPPVPPIPPMPAIALANANGSTAPPHRYAQGSYDASHMEHHYSPGFPRRRTSHQRTASDSTNLGRPRFDEAHRPKSSPVAVDVDDLYDVSPPGSPSGAPQRPVTTESSQQESRRPSNITISSATVSVPGSSLSPNDVPLPTSPGVMHSSMSLDADSRANLPAVNLHMPPSQEPTLPEDIDTEPGFRRLSNAQTWPAGLGAETSEMGYDMGHAPQYPMSSPYQNASTGNLVSSLPPAPSSSQMASLNHRISQGNPRRLSGGYYNSASHLRGYSSEGSPQHHSRSGSGGLSNGWHSGPDQPLIISTPRGVSGAFDPPTRQASRRQHELPLVAPVPRHPRPGYGASPRPTVERLETIYSVTSPNEPQRRPPMQSARRLLASWRRSPSVSPGSVPVGVNRQHSRAERSAAKNMKDAKKMGWAPKKSNKKKKKKKDFDAASSAAWTDVSNPSTRNVNLKEKKCAVM